MHQQTDRITRVERANWRLTLALVTVGALGAGAVLAGFAQAQAQPRAPEPSPYVGLSIHPETNFLYRMHADGGLERLSLGRGRTANGGTPAVWKPFPVGTDLRSP